MTTVSIMIAISLVLLVAALVIAVYRLARGPNALDRAVALDVFSAAVIAVVVIFIAFRGRTDLGALLIVFVLTAFFSAVSVSRFIMVGRARKPRGRVVPVSVTVENAAAAEAETATQGEDGSLADVQSAGRREGVSGG